MRLRSAVRCPAALAPPAWRPLRRPVAATAAATVVGCCWAPLLAVSHCDPAHGGCSGATTETSRRPKAAMKRWVRRKGVTVADVPRVITTFYVVSTQATALHLPTT